MKIIYINTTCGRGSTGRIVESVANLAAENNHECEIVYGYGATEYGYSIIVQNKRGYYLNNALSRICANEGKTNSFSTKRLLRYFDNEKPDILHLHNLHGHYMNCELLFQYIKAHDIPVVWTLHDCWAFTGHCPHFSLVDCDKWKTGCHHCQQYKSYPQALWDNTRTMWHLKKGWFTGVKRLILVTPSQWLAQLVRESFLCEYPVVVINNGIDTEIFKPTPSGFRETYHLQKKKWSSALRLVGAEEKVWMSF